MAHYQFGNGGASDHSFPRSRNFDFFNNFYQVYQQKIQISEEQENIKQFKKNEDRKKKVQVL